MDYTNFPVYSSFLLSTSTKNDNFSRLLLDANASSTADPFHGDELKDVYNADRESTFQLLLERKASVDYAHVGRRPLLMQALADGKSVLKMLLDAKANMNCFNALGFTPLMLAVEKQNYDAAKMLIGAIAPLDTIDSSRGLEDQVYSVAFSQEEPLWHRSSTAIWLVQPQWIC